MGLFGPSPRSNGSRSSVGAESTAIIAAKLVQSGYVVLTPYGSIHLHDLLIEDAEGQFWRLWCRTAWFSKDRTAILFDGSSPFEKKVAARRSSLKEKSRNDVDYFAVYHPRLHKVYLLPALHTAQGENSLQLTPKGREQEGMWAQDYEL